METNSLDTSSDLRPIVYQGDESRSIVDEMQKCYLEYAMSVIVQRALPDVRDGLKPVHRRILYAMHLEGLRASAKYKKSAKIVGNVLWSFHPHGDTAVYDAMVRMAQEFSLRYPLIDGQGNFGSIDGDSAAAYRYTEARMSRPAEYMLSDIDKDTVDFRPNFDASTEEPSVLPARIPNLLINGVMGIAVGMATNIPPHNLGEVIDALDYMMASEDMSQISVDDLMQFIKGPDFPTAGIIYNSKDIHQAYATGRWSVVIRGRAVFEDDSKGRTSIIITEIPYQLNKATFVQKIAELVTEKIIVGVAALQDESNKDGIRIVIELKRDAFPKKILNQLYKLTPLQTSFSYNMIALDDRGMQPKLFNLKEILESFLKHRREVVTRRVSYDLRIAEARAHILQGLKIALDHIDEVIETIRSSQSREDANALLCQRFWLTTIQAQAILEMQLQRLSWLERQKIEDELAEKLAFIAGCLDILAKPERVTAIMREELSLIREKFSDPRRTEVVSGMIGEFNPKDTIPNEEVVITLSKNSYIKRIKSSAFRTQKRGGKWVTVGLKDEDEVSIILSTTNHNDLYYFTNTGRVFRLPAYEIPEASRTTKWQPLINFIALLKDEKITAILDPSTQQIKYLALISRNALIKRIDFSEITNIRSNGLIVMKPKENDELAWVKVTTGDDNILVVSKKGKAIQFHETDVRVMWRAAAGVRAMRMSAGDEIVEADVVSHDGKFVFIVTENGMGKISECSEYREQGRWWSGVKAGAVTPKTGDIIYVSLLTEELKKEASVILMSRDGQTVRVPLSTVRTTSRVTQWVILAKLKNPKDAFISVVVVTTADQEDDDQNSSTSDE